MEGTEHVHIELDVERAGGPIEGELTTSHGRERFAGWLELTVALERARSASPTEEDPAR